MFRNGDQPDSEGRSMLWWTLCSDCPVSSCLRLFFLTNRDRTCYNTGVCLLLPFRCALCPSHSCPSISFYFFCTPHKPPTLPIPIHFAWPHPNHEDGPDGRWRSILSSWLCGYLSALVSDPSAFLTHLSSSHATLKTLPFFAAQSILGIASSFLLIPIIIFSRNPISHYLL